MGIRDPFGNPIRILQRARPRRRRPPDPQPPTTGERDDAAPSKPAENVWTDEERAAMQASAHASARPRRSAARRRSGPRARRRSCAKIAEMPEPDRVMARAHPRDRHGQRTDARADGRTTACRPTPGTARRSASSSPRRSSRSATRPSASSSDAKLDDGDMWPIAFDVDEADPGVEKQIAELVKKAVG